MKHELRDLYITFENGDELIQAERYFTENTQFMGEIDIENNQLVFPVEYDILCDFIKRLTDELYALNIQEFYFESY